MSARGRRLPRPWLIALGALSPIPVVVVSILAGRACDAHQSAESLGHAIWTETAAGPRLLVIEHLPRSGDDGPSYVIHRIVSIDPRDGTVAGPWMLPQTGDMEATVLWAARGPWVWTLSGDAWHPTWSLGRFGEEPLGLDSLQARFPQVMAPWAATQVDPDGLLRVESDDKRQWEVDVAADTAAERPGMYVNGRFWAGSDNTGCRSLVWRGHDRAFVARESERHSQPAPYALVRATVDEYGQATEQSQIAADFSAPSFLCDGNGHIATVAEDALISEGDPTLRISRLSDAGERVWSWRPGVDGSIEAWSGPDAGATIRIDRTFYGLDAQGHERWHTAR